MRRWLIALGVVALLLGLAFVVRIWVIHHGHIEEPLEITMRLEEGTTGKPVKDAVVLVLRYESLLASEYFPEYRAEALRYGTELWDWWVVSKEVSGEAPVTLKGNVNVTRWWLGPVEISKEIHVPELLVIEREGVERELVPIPRDARLEPGDESDTYKLDLGTIRVPQTAER